MSFQSEIAGGAGPGLLGPGDPQPVGEMNADSRSRIFLICDHAGNAVPTALNDLGLPASELSRHIGIDIGALPVAEGLAARLDAPLVFQRYSRLVIDCNRRTDASASMPVVADGTPVPGNENLDAAARAARVDAILTPYHDTIRRRLDARAAAGIPTLLVAVHSFTPSLKARPADRPWHVGLCWAEHGVFSHHVLRALAREGDFVLGENEPYTVDMTNDYSIPEHGEKRGLPYAELEIRQDLIGDPGGQTRWADRLARVLTAAAETFDRDENGRNGSA
ncbi:N-formylglutamate amidohydrolase [Fodinicurvata sp. EGI_FJ10296]|uniref:N-formylglutamate amidohydrolase n=1 Tax=Fodinicurvata sp. EGI_FJ10296 TaxID=3231908 RepID=UPI00345725DD